MPKYNRFGRGGRRALAASLVAATAIALGGCSSAHNEAARTPGAAGASPAPVGMATSSPHASKSAGHASPKPTGSPGPSATETGKAKPPPAPLAKAYKPVIRNGKTPHPTIHAATEKFSNAAKYSDGLKIAVTKIHQGVESGYGPGVFVGAPTTLLKVTLRNGTKKPINLQRVVVQMTYGDPARLASPVYGDAAQDFNGTVKPGATANATYVFSVPVAHLKHATMTVDFDGKHAAAKFSGALKK